MTATKADGRRIVVHQTTNREAAEIVRRLCEGIIEEIPAQEPDVKHSSDEFHWSQH